MACRIVTSAPGVPYQDGVAVSVFTLRSAMATGLSAALAYLGPRGSEVLFMRWFAARVEKG